MDASSDDDEQPLWDPKWFSITALPDLAERASAQTNSQKPYMPLDPAEVPDSLPPSEPLSKLIDDDEREDESPLDQVADSPKSACAVIDEVLDHVITSTMTCVEIVELLVKHGCVDLTLNLDESASSKNPLAEGGLGDVYRGQFHDGTLIAIKTIRASGDEMTGVYQKRAAREVYVWSKCKHKNIAMMIGLTVFNGSLAMVSLWEPHGNMMRYLSRNPSANRCQLSIGVCAGLSYLHNNNIVHGDLKGANVLIDQDGIPMLTDFGNATLLNATLGFTQTKGATKFTVRWAAPEILDEGTHTTASDVYSLGMTILETFTSTVPFDHLKSEIAVIRHLISGNAIPTRPEATIPKNSISGDELWGLLTKCWSHDPAERPSAEEVWNTLKPLTPAKLEEIGEGVRVKRRRIG